MMMIIVIDPSNQRFVFVRYLRTNFHVFSGAGFFSINRYLYLNRRPEKRTFFLICVYFSYSKKGNILVVLAPNHLFYSIYLFITWTVVVQTKHSRWLRCNDTLIQIWWNKKYNKTERTHTINPIERRFQCFLLLYTAPTELETRKQLSLSLTVICSSSSYK